jgi:hypothetical protein
MQSSPRVQSRSKLVQAAVLWGAVLTGCAADAGEADEPVAVEAEALSSHCAASIPESLAVPRGNRLAFQLDADGVQIYQCQAPATGAPAWVFQAPAADLTKKNGRSAGTHYAGPTWESNDGSTVVGSKLASYTGDASAIPWLLLQAASHTGRGHMSKVTFIQRLDTAGGLAPSTGCDAEHVGRTTGVAYTATYAFYEGSPVMHSRH